MEPVWTEVRITTDSTSVGRFSSPSRHISTHPARTNITDTSLNSPLPTSSTSSRPLPRDRSGRFRPAGTGRRGRRTPTTPAAADQRHPGGAGRTYAEAVTPIVATVLGEIAGAEDPGRPAPPPLFNGAPFGQTPGARLLPSAALTPRPDFMSNAPARHFNVATPVEAVVAGKSGPATPSLSPTTTPHAWPGGMVQTRHGALSTPFREGGATAYAVGQPASALRTSSSSFRVSPRATGILHGECLIILLVICSNLASMNRRRAPMWTTGGCARKTEPVHMRNASTGMTQAPTESTVLTEHAEVNSMPPTNTESPTSELAVEAATLTPMNTESSNAELDRARSPSLTSFQIESVKVVTAEAVQAITVPILGRMD
ncbi:hypothetical protein CYMTET_51782 [Cymbomonas tetramitiformis]|uniref:Uncharacterized protein n=1 Tax=Cymbomonas tetramitiformis TaxID=36881 RepID=A0AAE0BM16_9CHLO|nr:hypothetical protein CYMTET_51782 [Cymbomonas tetramitiformis]